MSISYDVYNREERDLCSHFFRLLHEKLIENFSESPVYNILKNLSNKPVKFYGNCFDTDNLNFSNLGLFTEVALIRDFYHKCSSNERIDFMNSLTEFIAEQQLGIVSYRKYSDLPSQLKNPSETHPKQIKLKAEQLKIDLSKDEIKLYGTIQAFFNAKPDLAIVFDNYLIVFEAKLTLNFDEHQLDRTKKIIEIWANLLYGELGFTKIPNYALVKLGLKKYTPDLSWEEIFDEVKRVYTSADRTFIAFSKINSF